MKINRTFLLSFVAGAVFLTSPVEAKESGNICQYTNNIVELSEISARGRDKFDFYESRPYGAMSAYLMARYADLPENAALSLFETAVEADFYNAQELLLAYQVFNADSASETDWVRLAIVNIISGETDIKRGTQLSLLRAVLLKSQAQPLFDVLSSNLELFEGFKQSSGNTTLGTLVADQSDQVRLDLAMRFEEASLYANAIDLLLTQPSLDPLLQFIKRHRNQDWLEDALNQGSNSFFYGYVQALKNGTEEEYLARIVPADRLVKRAELAQIIAGDQHIRFSMMSGEMLNILEDWGYAARVAQLIDAKVQAGNFDPLQMPFRPLTMVYEEYLAYSSAAQDYFGYNSNPYWNFETGHEFMQFYIAGLALEPFVTGQSSMPEKPWPLAQTFNWKFWQNIAEAVRIDDVTMLEQSFADAPKPIAELLFRAGKFQQVTDLLLKMGEAPIAFELAEQFALRLDLRCQGYLDAPSMTYGKPVFRFD